jgi:hypothetical protein
MLRILIASVVALSFVSHASAASEEDKAKFFSRMATGECWSKCAALSSMEACITCGVASGHSERGVLLYCHKLQPKCGRLAGGLKPADGAGKKRGGAAHPCASLFQSRTRKHGGRVVLPQPECTL